MLNMYHHIPSTNHSSPLIPAFTAIQCNHNSGGILKGSIYTHTHKVQSNCPTKHMDSLLWLVQCMTCMTGSMKETSSKSMHHKKELPEFPLNNHDLYHWTHLWSFPRTLCAIIGPQTAADSNIYISISYRTYISVWKARKWEGFLHQQLSSYLWSYLKPAQVHKLV